ncbi:Cytochrome c-552 [Methylacidimicrobium cyclopophantes]|uniref:Cytochrome c-552 n=1 Tax=Methylacidimicrobium cyclopophantes TaxID=1041766 RepID=A0A5E6M576_9BACT|nr:cytochrome c [Methylacidimicrobium cyclopophantes]VVM04488.1 Cytochrome c-552 [Methylacidimicrobium cyclopophantes]
MNLEDPSVKIAGDVEPEERIPCAFWVFSTIALLFAAAFFFRYDGGFRWDVYDANGYLAGLPRAAAAGVAEGKAGAAAPKPAAASPLEVGREQYQANCAACHQPTGQGMSGQFPPVAGSEWVDGDPRLLAAIVLGGLQGPVKVAGADYNGMMPAWQKTLSDAKIAAILTFLRQSWGNHASAVSEDEVKAVRAEIASHAAPWKIEELRTLSGEKGKKKEN